MYKIRTISCHFKDLYFWGRGFASLEAHDAWFKFWEGINLRRVSLHGDVFHWQYCPPVSQVSCGYLVSSSGVIYLHPMDFSTILHGTNGPDLGVIRELKSLCEQAAKACGTTCHFSMSELHEISALKNENLPK